MLSLTPWRERGDIERFRSEMDSLFDRFFRLEPFKSVEPGRWMPSIDVSETPKEIIVKAEIPGMEAKDIDVSISGNLVTIQGERRHETEEKDENFHRMERTYGAFSRSIQLPADVDPEKVTASYKKGILKLSLAKLKEHSSKKIQVRS